METFAPAGCRGGGGEGLGTGDPSGSARLKNDDAIVVKKLAT
jgi:hypothetical protein